ncbi:MAG: lipoyl synthase, partial [Porticoccaceae bacterium]
MTSNLVDPPKRTKRLQQGEKLRSADKVERIPVKVIPTTEYQSKPEWMRIRLNASPRVNEIKSILREHKMATVCEEAACPNLHECFSHGTATFMIMGEICTRRCPFCDVGHGKPNPLDQDEPLNLAKAISEMALSYVVITSVDRDDLRDGGAQHFADCIRESRRLSPNLKVEVLVPDFRGRMAPALDILTATPPDVFNHNIETVPSLYLKVRPGSRYFASLELLKNAKKVNKNIFTKS